MSGNTTARPATGARNRPGYGGRTAAFGRTTKYETGDGWEYDRGVWAMDTATRQLRQIGTARNALSGPVDWSPDGRRIVYVTEYGLSAADGRNLQVLRDRAVTPTDWLNA